MFVTLIAAVISTQPSPLQEVQYRSYDVAGALKHLLVNRDGTVQRMLWIRR